MKTRIFKLFTLVVIFLMTTSCQSDSPKVNHKNQLLSKGNVLDFYRQYSSFTDPGKYASLYENLPDSLPELCHLIRAQFIHPYAELPRYENQIPQERADEYLKYPTVKSILEGLLSLDSRGLVKDRKIEHRLVLGCRHYAIVLASIMKYRGIPARVRCGHATYLIPDFHTSHTICEVWNERENRWMLVDPDGLMIDFSKEKFDFSNELWLKLQKGEVDLDRYGIPGQYSGFVSIVAKVCHDLASVLGTEYPIYQYAPVLDYAFKNNNQLTSKQIEILNKVSELMKSLDAENLLKLQEIYNSSPQIQITKTFNPNATAAENNESSEAKPDIEFVDISAGKFMMGSPASEIGRKDDEIQHEVTLSAFKMSKYLVTYEQYNAFCEATGKRKPRGFKPGNLPVAHVTWHDAKAFADWMGCRLPTEAEFEYAARANTTTPFNTGDCLTSDQANFNGKKPYDNCDKGKYKGKSLSVGSFQPNAFGLYDMHGNIGEWCNDWYGEYDLKVTSNPQGPETGEQKVLRGGGWRDAAVNCRSACRDKVHPGNRGAGMGFRLVKSE